MSDIVERLRARMVATLNEDWQKGKKCPDCGYERYGQSTCPMKAGGACRGFDPDNYRLTDADYTYSPEPEAHEAADTITRLRAELERVKAERDEAREGLTRARIFGLSGKMWSATEAWKLGKWIDAGMNGPLPNIESPFVLEEMETRRERDAARPEVT